MLNFILLSFAVGSFGAEVCDDASLLQTAHYPISNLETVRQGIYNIRHGHLTAETFLGMSAAAVAFAIWELWSLQKARDVESYSSKDRWWLIVMAALVEVVSGSIYAMGAWQDELRDLLQISATGATIIGAMPFVANLVGFSGGLLFDKMGPRAPVCIGSCGMTLGYCLMGMSISFPIHTTWKLALTAFSSLLIGFCSVSLMDNIVCMACSVSFPRNRAAVVGYLKAVLATAGGLWALLWAQVFRPWGLLAFLAVQAIACFGVGVVSLSSAKVLPAEIRGPFTGSEYPQALVLLLLLTLLTVFDVFCSYQFSRGIHLTPLVGLVGVGLQLAPTLVLFKPSKTEEALHGHSPRSNPEKTGLPFSVAVQGMDFWLLWSCQFAIFGAGVATNQNLALILESAGHNTSSSLGVALFALTSALARVAAGILSDKYQAYFSRYHWLTAGACCAMLGEFLVSLMSFQGIMMGTLLMGLSFGSFYTIIVPLVNEMYGQLEFGKMWGVQMSSQAFAALIIVGEVMPVIYRRAADGEEVCMGPGCYKASFLLLSALNAWGLVSALALQVRNSDSTPATRLSEA